MKVDDGGGWGRVGGVILGVLATRPTLVRARTSTTPGATALAGKLRLAAPPQASTLVWRRSGARRGEHAYRAAMRPHGALHVHVLWHCRQSAQGGFENRRRGHHVVVCRRGSDGDVRVDAARERLVLPPKTRGLTFRLEPGNRSPPAHHHPPSAPRSRTLPSLPDSPTGCGCSGAVLRVWIRYRRTSSYPPRVQWRE